MEASKAVSAQNLSDSIEKGSPCHDDRRPIVALLNASDRYPQKLLSGGANLPQLLVQGLNRNNASTGGLDTRKHVVVRVTQGTQLREQVPCVHRDSLVSVRRSHQIA